MQLSRDLATTTGTDPEELGPTAEMQLFCLPHAGGTSGHFRGWHWLAPYARVVPVELPGHGSRLREPLIEDWQVLVDNLTETIARRVDGPYAVLGHSLGSLLAYEICRALERRGMPPALLVAAGRNGPAAPPSYPHIHELPDPQFIAALRRLGGIPDGVLHQPELLQMFLPVLRADLRLAERYTRTPGLPLQVPVMAFAGRSDPMTDDLGLLSWKRETTQTCDLVFLDGGHFFLDQPEFTDALTERIARLAYRLPEPGADRTAA
ncbi:thioesterase II family protein [Streptomyces beijiangensis]|uniref:Thioesterase n=1 Tax=Streptomyces beijiangensis TaxID=163361 RepID=A0A939FAG9_9ACTN|nr:alpha/beta fold hydrolase [Streptomyces beijiangensis]MBO0514508.1 thioesterase [Streptomyces beijiangensis]